MEVIMVIYYGFREYKVTVTEQGLLVGALGIIIPFN